MTTVTIEENVAAAIAAAVPNVVTVTAVPTTDRPGAGVTAVRGTWVGARSAELAIALTDPASLLAVDVALGEQLSLVDVLRTTLDAAGAVLGTGVLSDAREEPASLVFDSRGTAVYALTTNQGLLGWCAVRLADDNATAVPVPPIGEVASRLGRIRDVEMSLTVEVGRTRMPVRSVLGLEPGAVVELDRSVGSPADILLNGRLIAHGEIVVVDQDYAVRITEILDVTEGTD